MQLPLRLPVKSWGYKKLISRLQTPWLIRYCHFLEVHDISDHSTPWKFRENGLWSCNDYLGDTQWNVARRCNFKITKIHTKIIDRIYFCTKSEKVRMDPIKRISITPSFNILCHLGPPIIFFKWLKSIIDDLAQKTNKWQHFLKCFVVWYLLNYWSNNLSCYIKDYYSWISRNTEWMLIILFSTNPRRCCFQISFF